MHPKNTFFLMVDLESLTCIDMCKKISQDQITHHSGKISCFIIEGSRFLSKLCILTYQHL